MKRFLLDNDGSNVFHNLADDLEAAVAETVRECPSNVSTYLVCSAAGCCYWPTKVGHVDPKAEGLVAAHARGLDPLGMLLQGLKSSGKETFITCRMNDVHNPTDADQANVPRIRRENPDCIVGVDEVRDGRAEWMSYCLDYTREDVRRYVTHLIEEQVSLYGHLIDGFQLDWMRFPRHLSGNPEDVWQKRRIITDFTAQVRDILGRAGRRIALSARVPATTEGCRRLGFDLAEWAGRGLIDLLVVCPFLTTDWRIPIRDFRGLLGNRPIPVYAGFDFGFGQQTHFPESLRGVSTSLYDCGADGIYVFNFPCWNEYLAARPYHWLSGLEDPITAASKPLLLAVDHERYRVAGVDRPAQIPAVLSPDQTVATTIHIPRMGLPAWRALCLVHSHGDVALAVDGKPAPPVPSQHEGNAGFRSEIFVEFVDQYGNTEARPAPGACRVFQVDPAFLRPGEMSLSLRNVSGKDMEIERVNLALW